MHPQPSSSAEATPIVVAALYKFTLLPDFRSLREPLLQLCEEAGLKGSLLLAAEGINGTVAGDRDGIDRLQTALHEMLGVEGLEYKESFARSNPFYRMKVRLKKEIVTMGVEGIDPNQVVGTYVEPEDWNDLIADPDVVLIDTRNDYEVEIGTFQGAVDPNTATFRAFPDWFQEQRDSGALDGKKLAMFCTGGIRCEKATAFVKQQGIDEVYHLKGGILKYLETVPEAESRWEGDCFVFDQRVSVTHGLALGSYDLCHACRAPLSAADKDSEYYATGVSCPKCHDKTDTTRKRMRFQERQRQMDLAEKAGRDHIGQVLTAKTKPAAPPEETDTLPILYSFRRCPYAMRARMALSATNRRCALREVALKDKPAAFIETSPKATVPVLALPDGRVLEESLDIMLWTLDQDDPEGWLSPETGDRAAMLALIAESDGPFKHHLDRYKYATRYAAGTDPIEHRSDGLRFLEKLNARLQETRYLFGDRVSLADIAIFPFIRQFANTDRAWFDAQPLPALQSWLEDLLTSERFQSIMKKHPVWHPDAPVTLFPG